MKNRKPLNVFLTIDTELSPKPIPPAGADVSAELDREIYAVTPQGEFGIRFQADLLRSCGLKGVFFVESLSANVAGMAPLQKVVDDIRNRGQEVQLHVHSEWLEYMNDSPLPGRTGYNLKEFSESEQTILIGLGLRNLKACGVSVCAFRAGNFGANFDTLRALTRCGIPFDSSHNTCALNSDCGIKTDDVLLQPAKILGVIEFPVTFFHDWPGHQRPMQLCACSSQELEAVLMAAWRSNWYSLVLVSHSFELLKSRRRRQGPLVSRILVKRYQRLCRFLAAHRDKFRTMTFSEVRPEELPPAKPTVPLRSAPYTTVWRYAEQLASRLL